MELDSDTPGTSRTGRNRLRRAAAALLAAVALPLPFLPTAHAASGAFTPTTDLIVGRAHHAGVRLADGGALVTGGTTPTGVLGSTEHYRQDTRSWSFGGTLATARSRHTATLLADGRVLAVAGRTTGGPLASAEVYDPEARRWSAAGTLTTGPRSAHTATLLPDGRVLITGGLSGQNVRAGNSCFCGELVSLPTAEVWNPATGLFTAVAPMSNARDGHTATLLASGRVLVVGGYREQSAEVYDPASNTWSPTGSMTTPRLDHTSTLLGDGTVLVAGGNLGGAGSTATAERYDPTTGTWSTTGPLRVTRADHTATLLHAGVCTTSSAPSWCGRVLVVGGDGQGPGTAELYNPLTGTWKAMGALNTPRSAHEAVILKKGGKVLISGGEGSGAERSAEIFAPGSPG